ncbi:YueI family protein [Alkalihalobacillus sp. BA299]|uniref:YueI family protein n=1 Tax=Alkalihalobacillus sp. BA299 TaxID=2815938 RepID=UPI001ADA7B81|nr:YueI family protein [Alkalihalobacillus sp. BA299]
MEDKLKDIINRGLYGNPEIKPEERNIFLTTIIERIHLALTKKQVIHKGMYDQAVTLLSKSNNIHLYINGNLSYSLYSNYVKEANKHNIPFTVVNANEQTPIGLVIATENQAINKSDIFIKDSFYEMEFHINEK